MIGRTQLEKRLEILRGDRDRTAAMLHVLSGAIQECEHWISVLSETEQENTDAEEA